MKLGQFVLPKNLGGVVNVIRERYGNDRIAVTLTGLDGERVAVLSTNLVDAPDPGTDRGRFYAKTWSENAPLRAHALASGLFTDTGIRVGTGFVEAEVWEIVPGRKACQ